MLEVRRPVCAPYSVALCALCGTCVPEQNTLAAVCTPPNPTTHCSRNDAALMLYRRWQLQLPATSPVPVSYFATIPSVAAQKVLRRIMSKGKHPSRARQPQCVCGDRASRPLPDCVVASMDTSAATRQHSRHQIVCESASWRGFVGCYQCATVPSPFARSPTTGIRLLHVGAPSLPWPAQEVRIAGHYSAVPTLFAAVFGQRHHAVEGTSRRSRVRTGP